MEKRKTRREVLTEWDFRFKYKRILHDFQLKFILLDDSRNSTIQK